VATLAEFSPTTHGFGFPNHFPSVPAWTIRIPAIGEVGLGNAANGLCGGMVFATRDFFEFGMRPPPGTDIPERGSQLFHYIVERLLASFDLPLGPARYYEMMGMADELIAQSSRAQWSEIKRTIDAGKLAPLGLIRVHSQALKDLGLNHQVLAYAYELVGAAGLKLHLYDPNHPGVAVEMGCNLSSLDPLELSYSTDEATRGFFLTPYARRDPRFLLGATAQPPASVLERLWSPLVRLLHL
jgi:hypothetical protein